LWDAADELRANSKLKSSEYSTPVLGLIFLRYADHKFTITKQELEGKSTVRRTIGKADYQARGVLYLPKTARFSTLLNLPEGEDIGKGINDAMHAIEADNEELQGSLPRTYNHLENDTLFTLLKTFNSIAMDIEGDVFGKIYEYFLGKFAMSEGQKGGEFFTPTSVVKLIVEVIEPFHGRIFDPACGSGGMFVQSASFVENHKANPNSEISIYGQEKTAETVRLCKMNLAVHGLSGDIREGNSYYENIHNTVEKFDFVMSNPPFNVNKINKERIKDDPRFPFGMPTPDNGNYIWIQIFYSALNQGGRAGFVMANSASDARGTELEIRKKIIKAGEVDVMVSVGSNFFSTVTLQCTLWFFDKGKKATDRQNRVLFLDARHIFKQVDRAHREFTHEQIQYLAYIVRLYRSEKVEDFIHYIDPAIDYLRNYETSDEQKAREILERLSIAEELRSQWQEQFEGNRYQNIPGLCRAATLSEIEAEGWSLNPGRYVGVAEREEDDFDFYERLEELNEELEMLNVEARGLEDRIAENVENLLEGEN